jgi:alkanesulfonate monooxygenase SsuD/methylene tetrahydromethanopterin reductase-like flavin-dependent oxidoreductase (luciferase family)
LTPVAEHLLNGGVTYGINIGAPYAEKTPDPRWLCDVVEEIEELGFDAMCVSDHILLHKDVHDSLVFLSALRRAPTGLPWGQAYSCCPFGTQPLWRNPFRSSITYLTAG